MFDQLSIEADIHFIIQTNFPNEDTKVFNKEIVGKWSERDIFYPQSGRRKACNFADTIVYFPLISNLNPC
jgi:hypothetical protein